MKKSNYSHPIFHAIDISFNKNFPKNQTIYIACSGGRDSMALLFACHQLNLPIYVLHINHKLQSISDDWQIMVETFCQNHQIPYQTLTLNWQNPSTVNEAHARTARYQAIADFVPANAIITTAHHANDQAETLLINLCKGTGLTGLIGMSELSLQHEFSKPLRLWRPLLTITRDQISEFVNTYQIPYVDDPTNTTGDNQRAFLREQILPKLNERFGNVVANINRTQANLEQAKTMIDEQVKQDWRDCQMLNHLYQSQLAIEPLANLPQARRFELLHVWVKGDEKFAPNRQLIEQIDRLIFSQNSEQQAIIQWQGVQIRRYRDVLYRLTKHYFEQLALTKQSLIEKCHLRDVLPNEKLQRLDKPFHEPFKKICQRLGIPHWERDVAKVLTDNGQSIALVFPYQYVWLSASESLTLEKKQALRQVFDDFYQKNSH